MAKDHHHHASKKYHPFFLKLNLVSLTVFVVTVFSNLSGSFLVAFDSFVNEAVAGNVSEFLTEVALVLSNWSDAYVIYFIGVSISLIFIFHCKWRRALVLLVSVTASLGAIAFMKSFFMRGRPENALALLNDASFPSGHAGISAAFFTALMYAFLPQIKSKELKIAFMIWCIAAFVSIGLSRIILNVHWFSDVVGGWALGIFIASGAVLLVKKITDVYSGE